MKSLPLLCVGDALLAIGSCPTLSEDCNCFDVIVSLLSIDETKELGILRLAHRWQGEKIRYMHFPVTKGCAPTTEYLKCIAEQICLSLQDGKRVYVFCRYGIGRAAMVGVICGMHYNKKPKEMTTYLRRQCDTFLRNRTQVAAIRQYYIELFRR